MSKNQLKKAEVNAKRETFMVLKRKIDSGSNQAAALEEMGEILAFLAKKGQESSLLQGYYMESFRKVRA